MMQRLVLTLAATLPLLGHSAAAVAGGADTPAGLVAAVGLTGVVKAKDHFVPIVIAAARNLTMPGASSSDVTYGDIHITTANLASSAVSFVGASQTIDLTLTGLSLRTGTTSFEVSKSIKPFGHLHCSGHFSAAISKTDIGESALIFPGPRDSLSATISRCMSLLARSESTSCRFLAVSLDVINANGLPQISANTSINFVRNLQFEPPR
jgi:hypothetical protein